MFASVRDPQCRECDNSRINTHPTNQDKPGRVDKYRAPIYNVCVASSGVFSRLVRVCVQLASFEYTVLRIWKIESLREKGTCASQHFNEHLPS